MSDQKQLLEQNLRFITILSRAKILSDILINHLPEPWKLDDVYAEGDDYSGKIVVVVALTDRQKFTVTFEEDES